MEYFSFLLFLGLIISVVSMLVDLCDGQSTAGYRLNQPSLTPQYTPEIFNHKIEEKPHFVMFYAPWCGHCKRLSRTFDQLAYKYNNQLSGSVVVVAKVDCTKHTALCSDNDVLSYPTLLFYWAKPDVQQKYKGKRDFHSLDEFVETMASEGPMNLFNTYRPTKVKSSSPSVHSMYELTSDTFAERIAAGQYFIDFYAPWCGHCKELEPVWDELRDTFEQDALVTVVKVDCTKSARLCSDNAVRGYPTLAYYNNGLKLEEYGGARDHESLVKFVVEMKAKVTSLYTDTVQSAIVEEIQPSDHSDKPSQAHVSTVAVRELTPEMLDIVGSEKGLQLLLFYAPWCSHCQMFAPTFVKLAEDFREKTAAVSFSQLDCTKGESICLELGIKGYPTIALYEDGKLIDWYNGPRTLLDLHNYLTFKLKVPPSRPTLTRQLTIDESTRKPSVIALTSADFILCIEIGFTFVNYYQPWCKHCQDLAVTWEELGLKYGTSTAITIASVNCQNEVELCKNQGIDRYPTLILYNEGEKVKMFEGSRDLERLVDFLETETSSSDKHDEL